LFRDRDSPLAQFVRETYRIIGCRLGMRIVLPHLTARRSAAIVNIGALTTRQPFPLTGLGAYTAAKGPSRT
jgi:NADP-dependent 3-hydroxy acid dehydrogenase YdfG